MAWLARAIAGLRGLFQSPRRERELDEELRDFVEMAAERHMAEGMPRDAALRAARLQLGSADAVKERVRDVWWESALQAVWQDAGYAWRMLRRAPGFAAVAILTLALGIGANTAIFSVVNSLWLRALPVEAPQRLVLVSSVDAGAQGEPWTYAIWEQIAARAALFDGALAWAPRTCNLAQGGETRPVDGLFVSGEYFSTLGVPALNRPHVHGGRRCARRRTGGAGGDRQLRLLAAALRRRGQYHRHAAHRRRRILRDRRRHAARVLRRGSRPRVRRRDPVRQRAVDARQGVDARPPACVLADGHAAVEAGAVDRAGVYGAARGDAADSRRRAAARRLALRAGISGRAVHAPAALVWRRFASEPARAAKRGDALGGPRRSGGGRHGAAAVPLHAAAAGAAGRGRGRAVHRLRQHRQPAAGARGRAACTR